MEFLIFLGIALGVILVLVAIANSRNRPGPESATERNRRLTREKASGFYRAGNDAMLRGRTAQAVEYWQEASDLGDNRGLTGLGIAEYRKGEQKEAKRLWRVAATRGEPSAQILLALGKRSTVNVSRSEYIQLLLRSEPRNGGSAVEMDRSELELFVNVAVFHGHEEYARRWIPHWERLHGKGMWH